MAYRRNRKRPLNPRQQKFVEQFLITGIGREAAIRAGYSPVGATESACRLRKLPYIAEAIRQGRASEARRAQVARERVLLELARVAFSDIGEVLDWNGADDVTLRPKAEISPHHRAAIAEIAPRKGAGPRIKLHNKARALDAIARHLGVFDKTVPAVDVAKQAREREANRGKVWRRFNEIVEERIAERCKNGNLVAVDPSLAAGAPLGTPAWENSVAMPGHDATNESSPVAGPPPVPSPSRGEGQGGGENAALIAARTPPAFSFSPSPSPLEGEGCLALASTVVGEPYAKLGEGSSSAVAPIAARTPPAEPPSPGRTFPPGFPFTPRR